MNKGSTLPTSKSKDKDTPYDPNDPEAVATFWDGARITLKGEAIGVARRPGVRGPGKRPAKESINIRLSPDVVAAFRASGEGWQARIDGALHDWLKTHSPV